MPCATFSIRGSAFEKSASLAPSVDSMQRAMAATERVLEVDNLQTFFYTRAGLAKAVDGVSFSLDRGRTLAIVGESGCGKSVTALSLMRLVADPPGRIVGGSVRLDGVDLLGLDETAMRGIRGNQISMIFQEPMTSLNPVMTIGRQISEALLLHQGMSKKAALDARRRDAASGRHSRAAAARQGISRTSSPAACASAP